MHLALLLVLLLAPAALAQTPKAEPLPSAPYVSLNVGVELHA